MAPHSVLARALLRFLPLAAVLTVTCAVVAGAAQQLLRTGANEPQVALARDAAAALNAGAVPENVLPARSVELTVSLSPFVAVFGTDGAQQTASARLHNLALPIPRGILDSARLREDRVTWQPEAGVRSALVAVPWKNGVVVAGRSLAESEARTDQLYHLIGAGWLAGLAGILAICLLVERVRGPSDRLATE